MDDNSGRIFIAIFVIPSMIITIFYTSSLTSFLILPGFSKPIQSFEELVESDLQWAKVCIKHALICQGKFKIDCFSQ